VHESLCAPLPGGLQEIACTTDHDPLELLPLPLPDGDEVDDNIDAFDRSAQAGRIGHVSFGQIATQGRELARLAPIADETPHRPSRLAQRVHDVAADESSPPGDENHFAGSRSKFCQDFTRFSV